MTLRTHQVEHNQVEQVEHNQVEQVGNTKLNTTKLNKWITPSWTSGSHQVDHTKLNNKQFSQNRCLIMPKQAF